MRPRRSVVLLFPKTLWLLWLECRALRGGSHTAPQTRDQGL